MTEIIFSFDSEDFTSNDGADTLVRYAEIMRRYSIRGGFCVVGLLAKQLKSWGRDDVREALSEHDILSHSYGHTVHPTINEYTDTEDFDEGYNEVIRQETEGLALLRDFFGDREILGACPPGNQKSYVAMYAYADMGLPIYADTVCDAADGRGTYYCNVHQMQYTFSLGKIFDADEAKMREVLDLLATYKRAIVFTHPQEVMFSEFWDTVNYYKENKHPFGEWEPCKRRSEADTERYYENVCKFIELMQKDGRFEFTSYDAVYKKLRVQGERRITRADMPAIKAALEKDFAPLKAPCSLSVADVFLAAKAMLLGKDSHVCGKVYGFLEKPYAITAPITVCAEDIIAAAKSMNTERFLPTEIAVGKHKVGPADWLRAALCVLCGEETVTIVPGAQLSSTALLPRLEKLSLLGWMQSDDFKDNYLSDRLRLQAWTLRV